MSATRLLILGAFNFMQPATGYDVRRELLTWHIDEHLNVKPGSIYGAIKTLVRDGCLAPEVPDADPVRYRVTGEGEKELMALLRDGWWRVSPPAEPLIPAMSMLPLMPRGELTRALQGRAGQLEARIGALTAKRATIQDGATGADGTIPEHVREIMDYLIGQAKAELEWSRAFAARLRSGRYPAIQD